MSVLGNRSVESYMIELMKIMFERLMLKYPGFMEVTVTTLLAKTEIIPLKQNSSLKYINFYTRIDLNSSKDQVPWQCNL